MKDRKRFKLPAKLFLISEILIFLMIVGFVLTEIIFPLSANIECRMIEEHQKWSPRFWDNVVNVLLEFGFPLTFLLSVVEIILSIKKYLPKKSCKKEILKIFLMFLSIIVSYFFWHIPLIFRLAVIIFFVSLFRDIRTIKNLRKQNVSVKEIIMFCIMLFNFSFFGFMNFALLVIYFGPRP